MAREWYNRPVNSGYTYVDGVTTGNYNNGVPNTYVKTWMEYLIIQDSTDKANNRSRIDVKLYSQVIDGGSSTGMSNTFTANNYGYVGYDNTNQQYLNTTYDFNGFALNKFADATLTIPHNADGTKTITLQGVFNTIPETWAIKGGSASASITLPAIDVYKPTTMASFTGQNYGYQSTLVLDRKASNLRENVTLSYGGTTLTLKTTSSSATTITFTVDRQYTPNTTKPSPSDWTLTITTYNGSTLIGTVTYTKQFTIRSDDTSYAPTLTAQPTAQAYNDVISALGNDTIVVGYSKLRVSANKSNVSLKYGATISQRYVRFCGSYNVGGVNDSTFTSNTIGTGDSVIWSYVVNDSRGFQVVVMDSYPYTTPSAPTIDIQECYRGLSNQTADESGTYIWVKAVVNYPSYNNHNSCTLKAQATGFSQVTLASGTRTAIATSASAQNAYAVTFTATDIITTTTNTRQIPSEDIPINIREGGKGLGLGAYCQGEGLLNIGYELDGAFKSKGGRYVATCNLLDQTIIERGALDGSTGVMVDWYARIRSEFTPIQPNTTYTISWNGNAIPSMFYYSSTKAYVTCELTSNEVTSYTFTTPSGVGFVKFTWGKSGNAYITPSDISYVQLEKGSQASSFVPYTMDGVEVAEKLRICEPLVAYGTEIPSNENLNTPTYVNVGLYYRADNATVATLSNCPTTVGFSMIVRNVNKTDVNSSAKTWQNLTREITDIDGNQFIQTAFCGSTVGTWVFGEWKQIIVGRKTGTLTANVGSFDEAYCRQSGDTVDIHGWLVGLSTSEQTHANAITVSGVSLPSVPIRFVFTCWLNNGIASYAGYGVLDTYGNITFVKGVANSNKVSFTITYVV